MSHPATPHRQRGAVAATVAAGIAFVLLLAVAIAHRDVLVESRLAANQQRAAQARQAAEAGVAWTLARLSEARAAGADCRAAAAGVTFRERYASAAGLAAAQAPACVRDDAGGWRCACPPDGNAGALAGSAEAPAAFRIVLSPGAVAGQLRVVSTGCAGTLATCEAEARSEATIAWLAPAARLPAAALTARGRITAGGALGAHHADAASGGLTLHAGASIDSPSARLTPPAGSLRATSVAGDDTTLAALDSERFFARHHGLARAAFRAHAERLACTQHDCTSELAARLAESSAQVVWLDGDVHLETPASFATPQRPVLIVVDGVLRIRGDIALHGLVHARGIEWAAGSGPAARVHGALLVDGDVSIDGSVDVIHDAALLARLQRQAARPVLVPGSWRDH